MSINAFETHKGTYIKPLKVNCLPQCAINISQISARQSRGIQDCSTHSHSFTNWSSSSTTFPFACQSSITVLAGAGGKSACLWESLLQPAVQQRRRTGLPLGTDGCKNSLILSFTSGSLKQKIHPDQDGNTYCIMHLSTSQ